MVGFHNPNYLGYHNTVEVLLSVCGGLSAIGSFAVLLSGVLFWKEIIAGKIYKQIIIMISLCDIFSSLAASWGTPINPTLCSAQAAITFFFFRATWTWSLFIVLTLWCFIIRGTEFVSFQKMSIFTWGVNLLLQFLPFTSRTYYGEDDDRLGKSICSFMSRVEKESLDSHQRSQDVKEWIIAVHYFPMILCVSLMAVFLVLIWRKVRSFDSTAGSRIRDLVRNISLYPIVTLLGWLPNCIAFIFAEYYYTSQPSEYVYYNYIFLPTRLTYCWAILSSAVSAMVFFRNSRDAREHWRDYLFPNRERVPISGAAGPIVDPEFTRNSHYEGELANVSRAEPVDSTLKPTSSPMW